MGTHPIFESDFDCLTVDGSLKATKLCTMPGVQDAYSIDVTNRFGLVDLGDDSGSECENVDPFEVMNALNAQAAENKAKAKNQPKTKENKIENKVETGDKTEKDSKNIRKTDDRNRGNSNRRGRGDGRGRGGDGERRGGNRNFDRRSADPKTGVKGADKKEGSGSYNWGTEKDGLEGQNEEKQAETDSKDADSPKEENSEKADAPEPEPEEPATLTLDEYRKMKKNIISNDKAKVIPQAKEQNKDEEPRELKKKGRASRVEQFVYDVAPLVQRGGGRGRGGRGRGGGRGSYNNRGGDKRSGEKSDKGFDLEADFPTLG